MKTIVLFTTVIAAAVAPQRVEVAAKTGGTVAEVYVKKGEVVRRGQPLATLETNHLVAEVRRAEAEVKRLRTVERDLEAAGGAKYEAAVAAREAAWMKAADIRREFFDSIIRSPFNGVVEARRINVGDKVGEGTVTFVVVQTDPLKATFAVPRQKAKQFYAGQKIDAIVPGGETYSGRIAIINGSKIEADIHNADGRLRPGMLLRWNTP